VLPASRLHSSLPGRKSESVVYTVAPRLVASTMKVPSATLGVRRPASGARRPPAVLANGKSDRRRLESVRRQRSNPEMDSALTSLDELFLMVLVRYYRYPKKYWLKGRPEADTSWLGPVNMAFRETLSIACATASSDQLQEAIRRQWVPFLNWHHLFLGTGFRSEMLADERIRAIHMQAEALRRAGLLPDTPPKKLASRVLHEARKRGQTTSLPRDFLDHRNSHDFDIEVLHSLFALDDTRCLTVSGNGCWTLNIQLLYDRLRDQGKQEEFVEALPEQSSEASDDPAAVVAKAEVVRMLRDLLDHFSELGPAEAAAVTRLRNGGSRREVANRWGVSQDQVRHADLKLRDKLARLASRLTG
jgi:hypothetical protein